LPLAGARAARSNLDALIGASSVVFVGFPVKLQHGTGGPCERQASSARSPAEETMTTATGIDHLVYAAADLQRGMDEIE